MSKITIIEGNSNEKDNTRAYMVKGEKGDPNTLSIGTVEETETAQASITGTAPNQTLNLGLPKAEPNTLSIGTVTKGNDASATITGDAPNQTLNLVLPKGDKGDTGPAGFEVPAGGVIGWDSSSAIPEGYEEVNGFENYSTTETKIGTWIDGKLLYKKTYNTYTETTSGSDVIYFFEEGTSFAQNIDVKNCDFSVKLEYLSSGNYLKAYNGNNGVLGTFFFGDNISDGNIYVSRSSFNVNYNVRTIEATIYYTKTTD